MRNQSAVGVVVIGRNEGERLARCLDALATVHLAGMVYADSGSVDGSVALARASGAAVVELAPDRPFTAARGRNEGFVALMAAAPNAEFVQFIDGDCEIDPDWIACASRYLAEHPNAAAVCGRLRERFPDRSVYNRLCDAEWDRPPGETLACGGIFMIRAQVFAALSGFREDLRAGEEPELCQRIRQSGLIIQRLVDQMSWHDADMTRFSQWWIRNRRVGFGFVQAYVQSDPPEVHVKRAVWGARFWSAILPVCLLLGCATLGLWLAVGFLVYPLQVLRVATRLKGGTRQRLERSFFLMLGKLPELVGQIEFLLAAGGRTVAPAFDYKR